MPEQDEMMTEKQIALQSALRFALQNEEGSQLLWYFLELAGVFQTSFTGNSETFFREGKRAVGLRLLNAIEEVDPKGFAKLQLKMADQHAEWAELEAAKEEAKNEKTD